MIIKLPYPNPKLSPNRKNGRFWGATKTIKDSVIDTAYILAKAEQCKNPDLKDAPIHVTVTFVQSDKRRRDLDNLLAASKPAFDGISRALEIDDSKFEPITIKRGYCKEESYMLVELVNVTD